MAALLFVTFIREKVVWADFQFNLFISYINILHEIWKMPIEKFFKKHIIAKKLDSGSVTYFVESSVFTIYIFFLSMKFLISCFLM